MTQIIQNFAYVMSVSLTVGAWNFLSIQQRSFVILHWKDYWYLFLWAGACDNCQTSITINSGVISSVSNFMSLFKFLTLKHWRYNLYTIFTPITDPWSSIFPTKSVISPMVTFLHRYNTNSGVIYLQCQIYTSDS